MINKIKDIVKRISDKMKWNLYLYYDGIKIKRIKVYRNELQDLKNKHYRIKVFFKKQIFKSNMVEIIVNPVVLLHTNEDKKQVCVGVVIEPGTKL